MREIERAVERAILVIHENYGEQIGVADLARAANYSRFHFTRLFSEVTGLTPRRFLVAVRLEKAKQLLTSTSLPVTDICHLVGYTSVGTFGSLFACSVGLPPTTYRRLGGGFRPRFSRGHGAGAGGGGDPRPPVVRGDISPAADRAVPVFVGLFADRIPCGRPVSCAVIDGPGPYALHDVPEGSWYLLACAESHERSAERGIGRTECPRSLEGTAAGDGRRGPLALAAMSIGSAGPIRVRGGIVRLVDVRLRPMGIFDPPVVPALPGMRPRAAGRRADPATPDKANLLV
jgi:AraC family transcriptional regulator